MTHTIIFKIMKTDGYIDAENTGFYFEEDEHTESFGDWQSDDINILNQKFKNQVQENYANFLNYKKMCSTHKHTVIDRITNSANYHTKLSCNKFRQAIDSYQDVFNRDINAFQQQYRNNYNSPIYVCCLFDDAYNYMGHIYCWINKTLCVGFGIRGHILNFFDKPAVKVAPNLLEGVRLFGLSNGCTKLFIPDPLPNMINILEDNGFAKKRIYQYNVGNSFMGYFNMISMYDESHGYFEPSVPGYLLDNITARQIIDRSDYGLSIHHGGTKNIRNTLEISTRNKTGVYCCPRQF